MKKNLDNSGFTLVELLTILLILVALGVFGYLVSKHINRGPTNSNTVVSGAVKYKTGTYFHETSNYPYVPSNFVLKDKLQNQNIDYTVKEKLSNIELEISKLCNLNNYSGGSTIDSGTEQIGSAPSQKDYGIACYNKQNLWSFNITAGTGINVWNVNVGSGPKEESCTSSC